MKKTILFVLSAFLFTTAFAQKLKLKEGDFKNLKGITEYNLVFDYSNLEIPKYDSEEDFLKDKMKKRDEKKAGNGEKFKKSWFGDRTEKYQPKFFESFNKRFKKKEITASENSNAKHTMKIHTVKLYPGYNVGVWRQDAKIHAVISVFESSNPEKVLISGLIKDVPGKKGNSFTGHYDFNSGDRIAECYAKLAKILAKTIKKKAK